MKNSTEVKTVCLASFIHLGRESFVSLGFDVGVVLPVGADIGDDALMQSAIGVKISQHKYSDFIELRQFIRCPDISAITNLTAWGKCRIIGALSHLLVDLSIASRNGDESARAAMVDVDTIQKLVHQL